jgi:hypothetical protein
MPGALWAQKVQLGRETTAGEAVAATSIWRGLGGHLKTERQTEMVNEMIGVATPSVRKYSPRVGGTWAMAETPFTPELGLHIFEAGIKGAVTGVEDGTGGSGFSYAYPLGNPTANTLKYYTLETGDNVQAEEGEYGFVEQFTISGEAGGVVNMSSGWRVRQVVKATFTGAISLQDVTQLLVSNSELYIDEPDGTLGATQIAAGNLLSFMLTVNTGWKGKWTADSGELFYSFAYFDKEAFSAQLQVKWEHDTALVAEKDAWLADTNRLMRIDILGQAYETAGTTPLLGTGVRGLRIDFPGTYMDFDALNAENGNSIVTATLEGGYEVESGEVLTLTVCNEDATIT